MKTTRMFSTILMVALFAGLSGIVSGCNTVGGIHGDGNVLKETRKVSGFDAVDVSGAFDIILKQGATEEVTVEADANLLPNIVTEVTGTTLRIDTRKPEHHVTTMRVYITLKDLKKIDVSGAVDITTDGRLSLQNLSVDASGSSDSKMDISVQRLELDCSGASKMKFSGTAVDVNMDLSGATDIFAYDLFSENYDLEISGAGNAQINVSKRLRAEISGAGSVKYKGSPTSIDQSVTGAGSIKKVE